MKFFIPITGQYHNIGDILHRRLLLKLLGEVGELHIYAGNVTIGFIEALILNNGQKIYDNFYSLSK